MISAINYSVNNAVNQVNLTNNANNINMAIYLTKCHGVLPIYRKQLVCIVRDINRKQFKEIRKNINEWNCERIEYEFEILNEILDETYCYYEIKNIRSKMAKFLCEEERSFGFNGANTSDEQIQEFRRMNKIYTPLNSIFYGVHDAVYRIAGNLSNHFCVYASKEIEQAKQLSESL
jgi:hypothetical protein